MSFTYIRRTAVALALIATAGCTVKNTEAPSLSGPSTLARSVTMTASPDRITQDGTDFSLIVPQVFGPDGRPLSGIQLRMDILVAGQPNDYGTLSYRAVSTGSDGKPTRQVVYTAPPAPPPPADTTTSTVSIRATIIGFDAQADSSVITDIRLVPKGVNLPQAGTPTAAFTFTPTALSANAPVLFDASASLPGAGATQIASYSWNFGDGASGSGKNVTHTFGAGNTFVVTLTVTNDRGLAASTSQTLSVNTAAVPNVVITSSPAAPVPGSTVNFNSDGTTYFGGAGPTSFQWTFGDGATSTLANPTHVYAAVGGYNVRLSVTDSLGRTGTNTATVTVVAVPPSTPPASPVAAFTFSAASFSAAAPALVNFDAATTLRPSGAAILNYRWNFGDGSPIVTVNGNSLTTHTYTVAGAYTVTLIVTDTNALTGSTTGAVTITP